MAVSTSATKKVYVSDGNTAQSYPIPFDFKDEDEILLYEIDPADATAFPIMKTRSTHYTVTPGGSPSVDLVGAYAPTSGHEMHIVRSTSKDQAILFPSSGAFPSSSAEEGLDRATLLVQESQGQIPKFYYPAMNDTVPTITTEAAIYTTQAIDAPTGTSGTVVCLFVSCIQAISGGAGTAEYVGLNVRNGPLGTVSDPLVSNTARLFTFPSASSTRTATVMYPYIRVDDGDFLTVTCSRNGLGSGTQTLMAGGGALAVAIDSY